MWGWCGSEHLSLLVVHSPSIHSTMRSDHDPIDRYEYHYVHYESWSRDWCQVHISLASQSVSPLAGGALVVASNLYQCSVHEQVEH